MPRRDAVPLYKSRHAAFVKAAHEASDPDRSTVSLLTIGTGARADTICHTHSSWFRYKPNGSLYYKIPSSDPCRKYGNTEPCGDCNKSNHKEYGPKTPAGEGREILISNEWSNPVTGEREYFGLKDMVESYFALDGTHAPDGVQHGHEMFQGHQPGICIGTLSDWIRDIAAQADISADLREDRIREVITVEEDRNIDQMYVFSPN